MLNLSSIMLPLTNIKDLHQCEDIDHVNAIVRTRPRATHMVHAGARGHHVIDPLDRQCSTKNVFIKNSLFAFVSNSTLILTVLIAFAPYGDVYCFRCVANDLSWLDKCPAQHL